MSRKVCVGCLCIWMWAAIVSVVDGGGLKTDFLGFHLGETEAESRAVLGDIELICDKTEGNETTWAYAGNHRLRGARLTMLGFWKGRLHLVIVGFNVEDELLYDALKPKLERRYGEMEKVICIGGKKCRRVADGMAIELHHDRKMFESDTVYLTAVHVALQGVIEAAKVARKGDEVGEL